MNSSSLPIASSKRVRAGLLAIWRADRARFVGVILLFGASAVLGLAPPRLVGMLIDRLGEGVGVSEIAGYCTVLLGCTLLQFTTLLFGTRAALVLGEDVFAKLRDDFMA
ncbi:MAG: hypothetical protein KF812_13145, partial [Fimbriimonadaceae bacterium]|nr:hypothetical protein [Fimbriimonadaceae bacterium]